MQDSIPFLAQITITPTGAFILLVLGFTFVVFIHELGHFLVAKWAGIRCPQFAVGFGHAILSYRKGIGVRFGTTEPEYQRRIDEYLRQQHPQPEPHGDSHGVGAGMTGNFEKEKPQTWSNRQIDQAAAALRLGETEYRWNWMPLGGYVKMVGQEDVGPVDQTDDPRSFMNKSIGARLAVVSAGVVMNAIFAVIFFIAAFMYGVEFPPAIIGDVLPGSPAATTAAEGDTQTIGLRPGDKVLEINGKPPMDFMDLAATAALAGAGDKIELRIERQSLPNEKPSQYRFLIEPTSQNGKLRMIGAAPPISLTLSSEDFQDPAFKSEFEKLGLRGGMKLISLNGQKLDGHHQVQLLLRQGKGQPVELLFADASDQRKLTLVPVTGLSGPGTNEPHAAHLLGLAPPVKIAKIIAGHPAQGLLKEGDLILAIAGHERPSLQQFYQIIPQQMNNPTEFTVLRDGRSQKVTVTPRAGKIGVVPAYATDGNYVASVLPDSPFLDLRLITPARIDRINGRPIRDYTELRRALAAAGGELEIAYTLPLPDAQQRQETRKLKIDEKATAALDDLPWLVDLPPFENLQIPQKADNAWQALGMGLHKTHVFMLQTYQTVARLLSRDVPVKEMRGPIGIFQAGTGFTQRGLTYLMFFLGLISINLAVINFLPLPIVDGGLAVLLLIEKLRGKPLSLQVQNAINFAGLLLIGSLFLFVTWNDVARLIMP